MRERVDTSTRSRSWVYRSNGWNLDRWHRYMDRRWRRGNIGLRVLRNSHWTRLLKVKGQRKIRSVWVCELGGWRRRRRWSRGRSHGWENESRVSGGGYWNLCSLLEKKDMGKKTWWKRDWTREQQNHRSSWNAVQGKNKLIHYYYYYYKSTNEKINV